MKSHKGLKGQPGAVTSRLTPAEVVSPYQAEVLAEIGPGADLNVFRTLAHYPGLLRKLYPCGAKLLDGGKLSSRWRELLILRVAALTDCTYEWAHHVVLAKAVGLTPEEIAAVQSYPEAGGWDPIETALLDAADQLAKTCDIEEDTWSALEQRLTLQQLIEVPLVVGWYRMLSGFIRSLRIASDLA